ncbi:winged helix-turn-helix transcriptional regulator [Glaciihabitans sp. INWT7]|nr:MarR family winged helix-turn-helix transcriptional regulator [Glaciihabitans sp. INWT7]QNE48291.1 winged helix-turn-helix transcriptional regulator [Glaciihabitans sp. INWT7]
MRYLNAEFPSGELSLNEYDVLFNLSRQPGQQLRMKDLNRHLLLTQPSVSRLVDRLTARGLLAKTHDQDDARGVNVALTPAGFDLFRRVARSHIESIAERVGGSLSVTELETLTELCDRLRLSAG